MRSHPYTPLRPLPPLLGHFNTDLPNQDPPFRRARSDDFDVSYEDSCGSGFGVPLADLDHDMGRLLQQPPQCKRKRLSHLVRIQGQLAFVRSVSVLNLPQPPPNQTLHGQDPPLLAARSDTGGDNDTKSDLGSQSRTATTTTGHSRSLWVTGRVGQREDLGAGAGKTWIQKMTKKNSWPGSEIPN